MKVTAYPVKGKAKSEDICEAFAVGCGGAVARGSPELLPGAAFFYGVDDSNLHLWRQAKAEGVSRTFLYCDNSYFDSTRQTYFRITRGRLQHTGYGTSDGERFRALGIEIAPWRVAGDHVVICPQSEHFMRAIVGFKGDWLRETVAALSEITERPLRIRHWNRDKTKAAAGLGADLEGAYALVTWSSAAAVTALLAGVPVIVGGDCAAAPVAGRTVFKLEKLPRKPREEWCGVLADNQWTIAEMADGTAWRALGTVAQQWFFEEHG